jgi:adenine-specific DNA-methyltransferase
MQRIADAHRLQATENSVYFVRFWNDFAVRSLTNLWSDTATGGFAEERLYVVQTGTKVLERCIQATTDPGDLVLDPTCGSGTTAYVAERWGRRWITCDTSRVPLALARQRLLTATFPYYKLKTPQAGPAGGFVYERKQNRKGEEIGGLIPHITLKSIANNEPPAMEVLVDRPEEAAGVTRVSGPFVVEASIAPVQPLETAGGDVGVDSDVSHSHPAHDGGSPPIENAAPAWQPRVDPVRRAPHGRHRVPARRSLGRREARGDRFRPRGRRHFDDAGLRVRARRTT